MNICNIYRAKLQLFFESFFKNKLQLVEISFNMGSRTLLHFIAWLLYIYFFFLIDVNPTL